MSGPIIRKYGFPNFEKIFGERDINHGASDEPAEGSSETPSLATKSEEGSPPGPDATKEQKESEDSAQL